MRTLVPSIRSAPATYVYLVVLVATTVVRYAVSGTDEHHLLTGSSTDVEHLRTHPLLVLLASAFWLPDQGSLLVLPVGLVVLATVERRFGTIRMLGVFAAGHVVATLVTEAAVAVAVDVGWLSAAHEHQIDVGPSYGGYAALGMLVAVASVAWRRWVWTGLGLLVVVPLAVDPEVTTSGHAIATLVGVGAVAGGSMVRRWRERATPRVPGRRASSSSSRC